MEPTLLDAPVKAARERVAGRATPVLYDLAYLRTAVSNLYLVGEPGAGDRGWVLVDAGMPGFAGRIVHAAGERFGRGARPSAIVLTHGHFDHVGTVRELAALWEVPVYVHELELPYVTGRSPYPPPDPTVGGGALAAMSWLFPRGPIDLGGRAKVLPLDGSVPGMPGWTWIHTPGHTPGHVALFRDMDHVLIAGDAFVTTRQESALAVLAQREEVHGPPAYFTPDWISARRSVEALAALEPELAATGHGVPMRGVRLKEGLRRLARDFESLAVPDHGRYVRTPAFADRGGVVSVPPVTADERARVLLGLGAAVAAGLAVGALARERRRT